MKVVNLEAEIKRTCQAVCGHDRKDCRWAHCKPGEGCTVIERLEEAQPVEAIPIDWIKAWGTAKQAHFMPTAIRLLLEGWQKEQEGEKV